MPRLLAYPVRMSADSSGFLSVEDGPDYYPQELVNLVLTHPGERDLVPEYGMDELLFSPLDRWDLAAKVSTFGPPVTVGDLTVTEVDGSRVAMEIEYEVNYDDPTVDGDVDIAAPFNGLVDATD